MKTELARYSLGVGDRFGFEGAAQLRALQKAETDGVHIVPVWNKSNREHSIIGTSPDSTRAAAEQAVRRTGWHHPYHVDADHIGLQTVGRFLDSSDFFTIDVADFIGKHAPAEAMASFVRAMQPYRGALRIPGASSTFDVSDEVLRTIAGKYLSAILEAGKVYRLIAERKGEGAFVPEISLDEAGTPQSPEELFFILAAVAREGIPLQTIAPKFSGSFLKGVDYVGDPQQFAREFEDDLAVVAFAVATFHLPANLKLSVHSGSDKFSIYPSIHRAIRKFNAGLHLKTAGTTWLEEMIGLAASGEAGLAIAKEIYAKAFARSDELTEPYLSVISIDRRRLPDPGRVNGWSSADFVEALRHDQSSPGFNRDFRQLVHVSFKVAAEMGERFTDGLRRCRETIEENVTSNLYLRHIRPVFLGLPIVAGGDQSGTGSESAAPGGGARSAAGSGTS